MFEFVTDAVALVFTHSLNDPLFHRHDGISAELGEIDREHDRSIGELE